jgi:hypothetical protein
MRAGHLCAPAWATAGVGLDADPLEQAWRLPSRRPCRRIG